MASYFNAILAICSFLLVTATGQKTYKIVTIDEPPFVFKEDKQLSGFLIDLLNELKKKVDFNYDLYFVEDGKYGAPQPDGSWNGMVGDLIKGKADIALAPLTVNSARLKVIDFSYPFMEVSILMTFRRPGQKERLPFQNLHDLIGTDFRYGAIKDGSTLNYLTTSNYTLHKEMKNVMDTWGNENPKNYREAIIKIKDEDYVHIGESSIMEFWTGQDCSLMSLGSEITRQAYALGFQKGSDLANTFNDPILKLREDGTIEKLRNKWWQSDKCRYPKLCICTDESAENEKKGDESSI